MTITTSTYDRSHLVIEVVIHVALFFEKNYIDSKIKMKREV